MISNTFNPKLFITLVLFFVLATIIGTLSHELGHVIVAEWNGHDAQLHYKSTTISIAGHNQSNISFEMFLITLGGAMQTMATGTIGVLLLYYFRKSFDLVNPLAIWQWGILFIALFWLRQSANFIIWSYEFFSSGKWPGRGDETKISRFLNLHDWTIGSITAIIGTIVLIVVIFKFIPPNQRLTFILAGAVGATSGYFIWMYWVGKMIFP